MSQGYCFACKSPTNGVICNETNKIGYLCFSCGARGHLDTSDYNVSHGEYSYYVNPCPNCGETNGYNGSMSDFSGIASGGFSEYARKQLGW